MDLYVFVAVLCAALLHAGWNAIVRIGVDRFTSIVLLSIGSASICVPLVFVFPVPAAAAWPLLLLSIVFHTGYKLFLIAAYKVGDLSQVYPLARGTAPVIVTLIAAVFLGELAAVDDILGILLIASGVIVMSMKGGAAFAAMPRKALILALITACFTAGYTLTDGLGARLSGSASGYAVWLFLLDGIAMVLVAVAWRGRGVIAPVRTHWRSGLAAGAMSLGSYWVAIWAFTLAPIALVGALRETSVLFALLIAAIFLKEPVGKWRWGAAALILAGVAALRL